jgi:hypothetical protein
MTTMMKKLTEKEFLPGATVDKFLIGNTKNLHDTGKLLLLILAREYGEARVQLRQNAT